MKSCTDTQPLPQWPLQVAWLLGLLAACFGAAGLGGAVTATSVGHWYQTLAKPTWSPPDGIFGPVWTVLYFLMAIAAWLVWRRTGWPGARAPLTWFAVQLVLNVGWSIAFFGLRSPGTAFAGILLLWLAIVATTFSFGSRSAWAAWLLAGGALYWQWSSPAARTQRLLRLLSSSTSEWRGSSIREGVQSARGSDSERKGCRG